jgi:hypothetical protein
MISCKAERLLMHVAQKCAAVFALRTRMKQKPEACRVNLFSRERCASYSDAQRSLQHFELLYRNFRASAAS